MGPRAALHNLHDVNALAFQLLKSRNYAPLIDHFYATPFQRTAQGLPPDPRNRGRWGKWKRKGCATRDYNDPTDYRYGKREYSSLLFDLPNGVNARDACYDPQNSPIVLGRVRAIMYCTRNLGGTWGHVFISDGLCGHCRNKDLSCIDDGDSTWHNPASLPP